MKPVRVGVLLGDLGKLNKAALKYLIVHLNTLQRAFEFAVLPADPKDSVITLLSSNGPVDRRAVRDQLSAFGERTQAFLSRLSEQYSLSQKTIPEGFILLTMAKFTDNWYAVSIPGVRVLALGNWDRHMAPPSLLEAIVGLTLRHAVALVSSSLSGSVHLGTRGGKRDRYDIDKMGSFGLWFGDATNSAGRSWWNGFSRLESRRGANAVVRESGRLPSIRAGFAVCS